MANEIKAKHGASTALTITLASLATSTVGVGRQSTLINNANLAQLIHLFYRITTGTTPTVDKSIKIYLIKGDDPASSAIRSDSAGASDAGLTVVCSELLVSINTTATSDQSYRGSVVIPNPGPEWGIAVVHDTGVNLNSTGSNQVIRYVTENPEVQ